MVVTRADVDAAVTRIAPHVRRTPIVEATVATRHGPRAVVLKLEHLQHTGSFKPRGMFNRLLSVDVPEAGVIVASGGNAGLAAAYAAATLGHRCEVFVPETTSGAKLDRLRALTRHVRLAGRVYADALEASTERAASTGALVVHAYDQPEVVAGQGTVAVELEAAAPSLDTVLVAVGGGGLIGGVAAWYAGHVSVVAVETEGCPTLHEALAAGSPVDVDVSGITADSLGARRVGSVCWTLRSLIGGTVLVSDDDVVAAQQLLWDALRQVVEPGGAAALAAVLSGRYIPDDGERVGIVVCGANVVR